jgi:hypothetical protein
MVADGIAAFRGMVGAVLVTVALPAVIEVVTIRIISLGGKRWR